MLTLIRRLAPALLVAALAAAPAHAQAPTGASPLDSGTFGVFSHGRLVASEDFRYEQHADSIFMTCDARGGMRAGDGNIKLFHKGVVLIVGADDFGLMHYVSNETFDGHTARREITPGDTVATAVLEIDTRGTADKLITPAGRLFVLDIHCFTLYDVIARNLHGRIFGPRSVITLVLGPKDNTVVTATARPAGRDTLSWGGRRVTCDKVEIGDDQAKFTLWVSPQGRLMRLEHLPSDLVVLRQQPALPKRGTRPKPKPKAH